MNANRKKSSPNSKPLKTSMQIAKTLYQRMLRKNSVKSKTRLNERCSRSGRERSASTNVSCKRHMRVRVLSFSRSKSPKLKCRSSITRLRSLSDRNVW